MNPAIAHSADEATRHEAQEYIQCASFIAQVIRTQRRKTADIRVEEGVVSIAVPLDLEPARIQQVLNSKRQWILQKLALHRQAMPASSKSFVSGESFPYLGRNYRLKVYSGSYQPAKLIQGRLEVFVPQGNEQAHRVRSALVRWYQQQAQNKLPSKAQRYAKLMGVTPQYIGIKTFKSRWGSCHGNGHIDFNWKIVLAPNRMVDYVVVHELSHLKHHDHSPQFWREVERIMPDYLECKAWLKHNAAQCEL